MGGTVLYNHYIPPNTSFHPIPPEDEPPVQQPAEHDHPHEEHTSARQKPPGSDLLGGLTGGIVEFLSSLFENFSLKNLDSGDILLLLIILFLFLEGDNLDLVIALGLMLLLGLGSDTQSSCD